MIFKPSGISGAFTINPRISSDERGVFIKEHDAKVFKENGLHSNIEQLNLSQNNSKGIIRGMHFQTEPFEEAKVMRCIKGEIFFVIVDMRKNSNTFLKWEGFHLSEENKITVYAPEMCATGYQALTDGAEALYSSSNIYAPKQEMGIRYDDPKVGIAWPITENISVSEKDKGWEFIKI